MGRKKKGAEPTPPKGDERAQAVVEPEGDQGIQTKLVLMSKPKPDDGGQRSEDEQANIRWVLKPMVPKGRRSGPPPSIGSMPIPGKP